MRLTRLLLCLLLLAAIGAAQTSSSSSQPADSSQGQALPLQEPAKDDKPKEEKQPAASFDPTRATTVSAQDQDVGEIRLMTRHTQINGDDTRSFRVDGQNNLGEFNYFFDRRFLVTRRMQLLSMYRGTDDRSIDPEHNSLQKAYLRLYGPRDEYIFGDTLVNFSRLTFNQNVKGVNATWKMGDDWKLATFGGAFVDRYGSFYKDLCTTTITNNCIPGRPYTAIVSGVRLERKLARESFLGVNFSTSDDLEDSLPFEPAGTAPFPAANRVVSLDLKSQWHAVRFDTEYAYSVTDFDTRSSTSCTAPCETRIPQPGLGSQTDWGARLDANWHRGKWSWRGSFARYQPNFASINARQIPDLQDALARGSYEATDWLTLDGTLRRSNNDLRGQLTFETVLWGPEARFIFHDLPVYRRGVVEMGYRHRNVSASDGSIDRYVRIPFVEFTLPYKSTSFSVGWERRQAVDLKQPSQSSNTNRFFIGYRGIYDLNGWHLSPNMRYEFERQAQRPRLGTTTPLELLLDYNNNRLTMVGFFLEPPKWFILEGAFRDTSATIPALGPTGLFLVPAGYSRPSYKAALSYKFRNDENTVFTFSFERNNSFYFTSPNFDERMIGVGFVYKFGHRGGGQ